MLTIRKVRTGADWRTMIEFPWALYQDDPHWVPPLLSQRRFMFDRINNPIWEYLDGEFFIAWRDERPVGTIGAAVNPLHNDYHHEKMGFFGHFEVYEDEEAAHALLGTAADWVRARGMEAIRGPLNMTVQDAIGCLVEGFDAPPMILMPHNPPYYGPFIEGAGFGKTMDLWAWRGSAEDVVNSRTFERMKRIVARQKERRNIHVRTADIDNLEDEIRLLQAIYRKSWSENWGFVPPTPAEIDHLVKELMMVFDPRIAFFAEQANEPIGFMLSLPDFNQVLIRAYPRPEVPEWLTLLKAAWHWKIRPKIDAIRILLLGVLPELQGQGVDRVMMYATFEAAVAAGYSHAEASWILEVNDAMNRGIEANGLTVEKVYRIYQKPLG